jgi:tetratricopeptide (TPR) repeat protein
MASSKRLEMLLKLTSGPSADSFAWYALAMEYRGLGRIDAALETFRKLREKDPAYVPTYQMCGTMLISAGLRDEAREWLLAGIEAARRSGIAKAASEMEEALKGLCSKAAQAMDQRLRSANTSSMPIENMCSRS